MKFRIIRYYERYMAQVFKGETYNGYSWEDEWMNIGSPNGYHSIEDAKNYCQEYKNYKEEKIVEVFEL